MVIIYFIIRQIDFFIFLNNIKSLNVFWFGASVLSFMISLLIVPYKWYQILSFNGIKYDFTMIFKINLISSYYNQLLPTRIGGDSVKYFILSKDGIVDKVKITSSIIIDRGFNLIGIFLIALFSSLVFSHKYFSNTKILFSFGFALFLLCIILLLPNVINDSMHKNIFIKGVVKYINIFKSMISTYKQLIFIPFFSLAYAFITFFMSYCIGKSLNINVPFEYYLTFLPIISIATVLPISFSGFGIREGGFIYYLGLLDVSNDKALALSLFSYFITLILSAPGVFLIKSFKVASMKSKIKIK